MTAFSPLFLPDDLHGSTFLLPYLLYLAQFHRASIRLMQLFITGMHHSSMHQLLAALADPFEIIHTVLKYMQIKYMGQGY